MCQELLQLVWVSMYSDIVAKGLIVLLCARKSVDEVRAMLPVLCFVGIIRF